MKLVILTGASGCGKTAIAEAVKRRAADPVDVLHFDSIGVPSSADMVAGWGESSEPGGPWQRAMTQSWIARIAQRRANERPLLFEGQMRPRFLDEALQAAQIQDARVVLVDCNDAIRSDRLKGVRNQPELADAATMNWAAFLRHEAQLMGYETMDTSNLSLEAAARHVYSVLMSIRREAVGPSSLGG